MIPGSEREIGTGMLVIGATHVKVMYSIVAHSITLTANQITFHLPLYREGAQINSMGALHYNVCGARPGARYHATSPGYRYIPGTTGSKFQGTTFVPEVFFLSC